RRPGGSRPPPGRGARGDRGTPLPRDDRRLGHAAASGGGGLSVVSPLAVLGAPFSLPELGANPVSLLLLLAGMSLLPFLLVMFTSFTKISVVLSLTRSALGTQQAPPTVVLTGLAAVLSLVVMSPVAEAMLARVQQARLPASPGPELLHV